jgi:hypothetical protein
MRIVVLDSTAVGGVSEGAGSPAYFSRFVIDHLLDLGHEITIANGVTPALTEANVVWSEWCNELAYVVAEMDVCKKLIIRMRGYDVWGPLDKMPWKNVHALVYESPFIQDLAEEQYAPLGCDVNDPLGLGLRTTVISSGIDLTAINYQRRNWSTKPVLALVARTTADKGYQLAFEYARQRPDIKMHVTTALGETNPRLLRYLYHAKPVNVQIHDTVDTCVWLNEIKATHLLSCSIWETLGYTIAEGMAVGCKPLIHDGPGLARNWPVEFLWRSFADLDKLVYGPLESDDYRAYVEKNLSAVHGSEAFARLVLR